MDARAECDVRELELAVLCIERQIHARQVACDDECDEIPEAVPDPPRNTKATFVRRSELVGLQRHLTRADAEKESVGVHLLA